MIERMHRKGIIVYYATTNYKQSKILDNSGAIVNGSISRTDLCVGACIEYRVKKQSSWIIFEDVDLIAWPNVSTIDDLLLLHQALEICLYCMPQGSLTEGVFEHIFYLYEGHIEQFSNSAFFKKIFLCKLFLMLGLYPEDKRFHSRFFEQLTTKSFDKLWCQPAIIANEKEIDEWLMMCIAIHVPTYRLKAMQLDKLIGVL